MLGASLPIWGSDTNRYMVEVIVFESLDPGALRSELWPTDPGLPSLSAALDLAGTGSDGMPHFRCQHGSENCRTLARSVVETRNGQAQDFYLLPPTEYRLDGVVRSLEALGRYRALVHLAWQQPALTRKRALSVRIAGGASRTATLSSAYASPPTFPYIDGSVRLYRGRYLHLLADLMLYRSESTVLPPDEEQRAPGADGRTTTEPTPPQPNRFRLSEHRRMRSGELHYLDHPLFGLLVQVTLYRNPEAAALTPEDADGRSDGHPLGDEVNEPTERDED